MAKCSGFHFYFLILCLSHIVQIPTYSLAKKCLPKNHTALFVFGDSYFDVGNNNYINTAANLQANHWPYGETFFKYPSGRFSDGRNIPDFIAEYAKLPISFPYLFPGYQPYIYGANFASAGAGALVETRKGLAIDLKTQLTYFKNVRKLLMQRLTEAEAKKLVPKAVYLISIGTNDYLAALDGSAFSSYSHDQYVDMVIGNLTDVIREIHKEGGGAKFGFLGLGPWGCIPLEKALANGTGSCLDEASNLAKLHNNALSLALQKLEKQLKGFKYSLIDFYDLETEVMKHPSKYGFKEGNVACCGSGPFRGSFPCGIGVGDYELCQNPNEYVFFDPVHPTDKANQFFAEQIWSANNNVAGPYNLKTLFQL